MDETHVSGTNANHTLDRGGPGAVRAAAELLGAAKEAELLRRELMELRKELAESKTQSGDMQKEHGDLHKQVEALRQENEQLVAEKVEAGQALAKMLETVQATNQIAQKLGVTKSPFARREAPAAAPQPAPHE